jgi:hypothetical protein
MTTVYLVIDRYSPDDHDPIYGGYEDYDDAAALADRLNREETDPVWAMNAAADEETLLQYAVIMVAIKPKAGGVE